VVKRREIGRCSLDLGKYVKTCLISSGLVNVLQLNGSICVVTLGGKLGSKGKCHIADAFARKSARSLRGGGGGGGGGGAVGRENTPVIAKRPGDLVCSEKARDAAAAKKLDGKKR